MKPRPARIEGDVAYVTLTKGYETIIDAEDVPLVEGYNWLCSHLGYALRSYKDPSRGGKVTRVYMHRIILDAPVGLEVDHIDLDRLNNCRSNLRLATRSQNNINRKLQKNNTSGFKGVSWLPHHKKWRSSIHLNRRQYPLGCFDTPEEAYEAYRKASEKLHGEFRRLE